MRLLRALQLITLRTPRTNVVAEWSSRRRSAQVRRSAIEAIALGCEPALGDGLHALTGTLMVFAQRRIAIQIH